MSNIFTILLLHGFFLHSLQDKGVKTIIKTKKGEYPYVINILSEGVHICAGSYLIRGWVVTTADCLRKKPANITLNLVLNCTKLDGSDGETRTSKATYIHNLYDADVNLHNIGLLSLNAPFTLGDKADDCEIVFGFDQMIPESDRSAISFTSGKGKTTCGIASGCSGESGSPVVCGGTLFGVLSGNIGCDIDSPATIEGIEYNMAWVKSIVGSLETRAKIACSDTKAGRPEPIDESELLYVAIFRTAAALD
ncbi:Trypsin [Popillia japonica]|uniref:Trypsin n=1 Tax=Popillia japonica TaxID=7064 RepID=A0AAW1M419_POPJA